MGIDLQALDPLFSLAPSSCEEKALTNPPNYAHERVDCCLGLLSLLASPIIPHQNRTRRSLRTSDLTIFMQVLAKIIKFLLLLGKDALLLNKHRKNIQQRE